MLGQPRPSTEHDVLAADRDGGLAALTSHFPASLHISSVPHEDHVVTLCYEVGSFVTLILALMHSVETTYARSASDVNSLVYAPEERVWPNPVSA